MLVLCSCQINQKYPEWQGILVLERECHLNQVFGPPAILKSHFPCELQGAAQYKLHVVFINGRMGVLMDMWVPCISFRESCLPWGHSPSRWEDLSKEAVGEFVSICVEVFVS